MSENVTVVATLPPLSGEHLQSEMFAELTGASLSIRSIANMEEPA